ncbi:putative acetyltransferase family, partial [Fimicolochytrium jonesii]|uniref:putative acetyltransferase family n=1 Tax=Fimicolochytrium jonesii TaxID=1396493 RepID=UPI0022FE2AF5
IQYHPITESNITRLRQLNSLLFPVRYNDKFYRDVLHVHPADLSCLAFLERLPIGAISCRKEPLYPATDPRHDPRHCRVYIMTLGVLSPYRRLRVGSALLGRVEEAAGKDAGVVELALHVQTSNTQALRFYERHGFVKATMVKDYYIKNNVQPPDAWVLRKSV